MTRLRPYLASLLLLLVGAGLALAIERALVAHPTSRQQLHEQLIEQMAEELDLTPAQRDSVDAIVRRHQPVIDSAWRSIHRHMNNAIDSVHQRMLGVLAPAQRAKFERLLREHH